MAKKSIYTFSFHKEALIWKILPDLSANSIIVESRDPQNQTCKYSVLDMDKLILKNIDAEISNSWWMNIVDFRYPYLMLEEYTDDQNPSIKNFNIFNVDSGKIQFSKNGAYLISNNKDNFVLGAEGDNKARVINYKDFQEQILEKKNVDSQPIFQKNENQKQFQLPVQYFEGDEYFRITSAYIYKLLNIRSVRAIEYLELENFICLSYYIREDEFLDNFLLVLNKKGEILFTDKLDSQLSGIGSETFFIFNKQLVFIKNKIELAVYPLIDNKL